MRKGESGNCREGDVVFHDLQMRGDVQTGLVLAKKRKSKEVAMSCALRQAIIHGKGQSRRK